VFRVSSLKRIIASMFVLLVGIGSTLAQSTVQMNVTPENASIGDPVSILITQKDVAVDDAVWPDFSSGQIGDLHILGIDTLKNRDAKKLGGASLQLTVAAYDTGRFEIGPLTFDDEKFSFDIPEKSITIQTVLTDSSGTEYNPYKAQEDLPITLADLLRWTLPFLIGIALIVLIVYLIRKWMKKRKQQDEDWVKPPVPPYEEAVRALARLKIDSPLKKGDLKGYVTLLSQIVKRLLERVHENPVLEMTTGEVRRWVRTSELRCETSDLIALLEQGDAVKFAKRVLDTTECDQLYAETEKIVVAYKPLPEEIEAVKEENKKAIVSSPDKKVEKAEVSHE